MVVSFGLAQEFAAVRGSEKPPVGVKPTTIRLRSACSTKWANEASDEQVVDARVGTRKVTQEAKKPRAAFWTTARPHKVPCSFPVPVAGRAMISPEENQGFVSDRHHEIMGGSI